MSEENIKDIRDTAIKLGEIYIQSPTDYAYLKGWIHCLLQKEDNTCNPRKPPHTACKNQHRRKTQI